MGSPDRPPPDAGTRSWTGAGTCPRPGDPVRRAKAKVPEGVGFPTKPEQAIAMLEHAWRRGCRCAEGAGMRSMATRHVCGRRSSVMVAGTCSRSRRPRRSGPSARRWWGPLAPPGAGGRGRTGVGVPPGTGTSRRGAERGRAPRRIPLRLSRSRSRPRHGRQGTGFADGRAGGGACRGWPGCRPRPVARAGDVIAGLGEEARQGRWPGRRFGSRPPPVDPGRRARSGRRGARWRSAAGLPGRTAGTGP
jgi:hypothetical protein